MLNFLALGDTHGNEMIYMRNILRYIKDFVPDVLILAGDICNFDAISYWNAKKAKRNINDAVKATLKEIDTVNEFLDEVDRVTPKKCKKKYIKGNHEDRLDKFQEEYAQLKKADIDSFLELKDRDYQIFPSSGWYKLGKLYFMHGQNYGSEFFTKAAAIKCHKNIRMWHHHTNQEFTATSPLDSSQKVTVKGVGCCCDMAPVYLHGKTNRWINSFLIGHVLENGNFQDYTVNVFNGNFIAPGGRVYK